MASGALDIGALYRTYGHSVLRRARQILGTDDDAKDVLHEIFTGLVSRPAQFSGKSAPSTFLYAATTNACLARLRDHKNRARLLAEHVKPWTTERDPRTVETRVLVRAVLAELPEDEAHAAVYSHLDGMSHAEIADVLGCSARHVGDLLVRATERLRGHKEAS
ncbi:MAG: sigma-70 family RNA polymerase sigma factor [Deltaproteobacteria bacterium]